MKDCIGPPILRAARRVLVLTLLAMAFVSSGHATNTQISSSGAALLQVVVKPGASTRVLASGSALAAKLSQISGATFTVVTGDGSTGIAVGIGSDFTTWPFGGSYFDPSDPTKTEYYAIRSHANGIYLAGASENAVDFAVWDLLYRLGYRQFTPSPAWEVVPSEPNLAIDIDVAERPDFYAREIFYGLNTWSPDQTAAFDVWKIRNRMAKGIKLNTQHAYTSIITRNQAAFDAHPEYRALVGGVRRGTKFCISNADLRQLVVNDTLAQFASSPNLQSVSLEPSDEGGWCECPDCAAIGNGSISDRVVFLNNQVMDAVNAVYPDKKYIGMYAYSFHSPPPSIAVNPRIVVSVATKLVKPGWTTDMLLDGWGAKGATLGIRDYYSVNFWDRGLPGRALGNNQKYVSTTIPKWTGKGVRFMNAEGTDAWAPCGFGYYLASRFLWKSPAAIPVFLLNSAGVDLDGVPGENTYGLVLPANASAGQAVSNAAGTVQLTLMTNATGNTGGPTGYLVSYFPTKALTALGDKITVTFTGSLSGVSSQDQAFRIGLFNSGSSKLTANSLSTTSNSILNAYTGYRADYRISGSSSNSDTIRERTGLSQNLFSTGTMAPVLTGAPTLPSANLAANTPFQCRFELEKTANGVQIKSVVNGAMGVVTDTTAPFTSFDTFSVFATAQTGLNVSLRVSDLSVSYSPAGTAIADNLAMLFSDFVSKSFGAAATPMAEFYTMCDKNSYPLLSNDLIGRMYAKVQTALNMTTDPKVRARIYDVALYCRYVDLYFNYTQEQDAVTRQTKFETLIRFSYRSRLSYMTASLDLYRDLEARDPLVSIPVGCTYDKSPPGNTWKVPSTGYTQAEIDTMITNGIAANPLLPWNPKSFSDDLVPATPLLLTSGTGSFGTFRSYTDMFTYFSTAPATLNFSVRAGVYNQTVGPANFSLYATEGLEAEPVSTASVVEDRVVHPVSMGTEFTGLHRLRLSDMSGGTVITAPTDAPFTVLATTDAAVTLTGRWTLYFYVPKGTTTVGGYTPYGSEGTLNDPTNTVVHTFNPATSYYFTIPVPAGQDGKVWKFNNGIGRRMLMTVPPYMARSASALLLPREVVEADTPP